MDDRGFNEVREEVLALDRESQITIAEEVLTNVSGSPEHEAAWRAEIRRRTEAYRRGEISTVDSDDVMARARQRIEQAARNGK
jgi:putative addiction module component (TIGR02574 family)